MDPKLRRLLGLDDPMSKWTVIIGGGLYVLIIAAALVLGTWPGAFKWLP